MHTRLWFMLPLLPITAVSLGAVSVLEQPARATIGLAEWEISTPGGHHISYIDPLKEKHGVSLRSKAEADLIYVDQIQWWQYYPGLVVGGAKQGIFLFDEGTKQVQYFAHEADLVTALNRRQVGAALSQRYSPQDGWNEAWRPFLQTRCAEVMNNPATQAQMSESELKAMRDYCSQFQ